MNKLLIVFIFCTFQANALQVAEAAPAPLSVHEGKIVANHQPANLAGNSLFWSNSGWGGDKYYTDETVRKLREEWRSDVIRIPVGVETSGGYLEAPQANMARVETVIRSSLARGLYVIVDWHSHEAEKHEAAALEFFSSISSKYGHHSNLIYEIYNEPLAVSWSGIIKPYAERVIKVIRNNDSDNLIIVGTPGWSQDVDIASLDPVDDTNTAYALHFYAGTHGQELRMKAQTALRNKLPLFVSEWGAVNADGKGTVNYDETQRWITFMRANDISHVNWAINDKNESASSFHPRSSRLTESGQLSRKIIMEWHSTH